MIEITPQFKSLTDMLQEHEQTSDVQAVLHNLLICGLAGPAMQQFFGTLSEQALAKLEKSTQQIYEYVLDVIHRNLHPALEEFLFRLSELRALSRWEERFAVLGLEVNNNSVVKSFFW